MENKENNYRNSAIAFSISFIGIIVCVIIALILNLK